jgi:ribosomal-protein-alanine N-acetyltransferase
MSNSIATIATPRLVGQAFAPSHLDDLRSLLTDPLVMKTLSATGKPHSESEIQSLLEQQLEHWRRHGFGFWVFHRRDDGRFIGRGGLRYYEIDGHDVIGLAYAVASDHWNQGFAREIARASIDIGFRQLGLSEIASFTLSINLASQRVMEKLGFRYEWDFEFAGLGHRFYRLAKEEWAG